MKILVPSKMQGLLVPLGLFCILALPGLTTAFAPASNRQLCTVPKVTDYHVGSTLRRFATVPEKEDRVVEDEHDATAASFLDKISAKNLFDGVPYTWLTIGVLKEDLPGENRVSQTPDTVRALVKAGFTVVVEQGGALGEEWFPSGASFCTPTHNDMFVLLLFLSRCQGFL